jgi:hypothetical protein
LIGFFSEELNSKRALLEAKVVYLKSLEINEFLNCFGQKMGRHGSSGTENLWK